MKSRPYQTPRKLLKKEAAEARKTFLREYQKHGCVVRAAKVAGRTRAWATYSRKQLPRFKEAWDEITQGLADQVEQTAFLWARDGVIERTVEELPFTGPNGEVTTKVITREKRTYNCAMTMFWLKKNRPEKYADHIGEFAGDFADEVHYAMAEVAQRWNLPEPEEDAVDSPDEVQRTEDEKNSLLPQGATT